MRMVAAIALIRGYDLRDDEVQTFVYSCLVGNAIADTFKTVSYTHLRAHETDSYLVCRLLLEKKNKTT